jgi:hypothetical protein
MLLRNFAELSSQYIALRIGQEIFSCNFFSLLSLQFCLQVKKVLNGLENYNEIDVSDKGLTSYFKFSIWRL